MALQIGRPMGWKIASMTALHFWQAHANWSVKFAFTVPVTLAGPPSTWRYVIGLPEKPMTARA